MAMTLAVTAFSLSAQTAPKTEIFAPFITRLKGEAIGSIVHLTWVDSQDARGPVYIYRSITPFDRSNLLYGITPVAVAYGEQSHIDIIDSLDIPEGVLYYFAVTSGEGGQRYNFHIISENLIAVQIPERYTEGLQDSETSSGQLPLFYIPADPRWVYIYPEDHEAKVQVVYKRPRAFAHDLEASPECNEEYDLMSMIRGPFAKLNWQLAEQELIYFLASPLPPEIEARARFYLGQCYYFQHQPRYGLFEFFAIHARYPAETTEWIEASVAMMNE